MIHHYTCNISKFYPSTHSLYLNLFIYFRDTFNDGFSDQNYLSFKTKVWNDPKIKSLTSGNTNSDCKFDVTPNEYVKLWLEYFLEIEIMVRMFFKRASLSLMAYVNSGLSKKGMLFYKHFFFSSSKG